MVAHTLSPRIDVATLTPAQRDGVACAVCADERGQMIPVGILEGGQLFAHPSCMAGGITEDCIIVIGDVTSPEALDETTAFASDVADRLKIPARIAFSMDYDVRQYEGAVILDSYLDSVASAVLATEAREADMFCIDVQELFTHPIDDTCGHCLEEGAKPYLVGDTWTTSVCDGCVAMTLAGTATGAPLAA
ncbi:hypothetical protein ACFCXK_14600 [Streptomyces sp. NPDC056269]|uniref:hypothetical protein n=1 Tax=Streptomyces sp. NPDC056269 TaxID=3345768 RepID=UPI0035D8E2A7